MPRRTRDHIKYTRSDFVTLYKILCEGVNPDNPLEVALVSRLEPISKGVDASNVMLDVTVSY